MNIYYVAGVPYTSELYHHGINGQKWGVRRFQNEDGTLTQAGRERYGVNNLGEYGTKKQGVIRKLATGDWALGNKRIGERREQRLQNKIQKRSEQGKDTTKLERKYETQKTRNVARDVYNSKQTTGKLVVQTLLLGEFGADAFRSARGRGKSFWDASYGTAFGLALNVPVASLIYDSYDTRRQLDKK